MAIRLPRPPAHDDRTQWGLWFDAVYKSLSGITGLLWNAIDKTGSRLSDIETRPHSDLQSIQELNVSSTDDTKNRHLSDAQAKVWQDHTNVIAGNPHNTALDMITDVVITTPSAGQGLVYSAGQWINGAVGGGGDIEGGNASSIYLTSMNIDGGGA